MANFLENLPTKIWIFNFFYISLQKSIKINDKTNNSFSGYTYQEFPTLRGIFHTARKGCR